ncbi:hypothetical protein ACF1AX_31130, partial [Streptomyces sp. NPDC014802]|uniref:hypothetical protein n=1 Tax=Streptomyces sp. NPDC014802 TaxID=3364917 RepID=UPI0037030F06
GDAVHLYAPPGSPNSLAVDAGQIITVAGPLKETDDAYLCGEGDACRAFPKSRWAVVQPSKKAAESGSEQKGGDS